MSRPTIEYPWVNHEQKSKEKNPPAIHPQNPIQKKRQGRVIKNFKEIITVFKDAFWDRLSNFLVNDFCVHSQTGPAPCPWVMTCDRWCAPWVGYIRTDREQGDSQCGWREKLDFERFSRKVQWPENCSSLPCYFWLMCPLQVCLF